MHQFWEYHAHQIWDDGYVQMKHWLVVVAVVAKEYMYPVNDANSLSHIILYLHPIHLLHSRQQWMASRVLVVETVDHRVAEQRLQTKV